MEVAGQVTNGSSRKEAIEFYRVSSPIKFDGSTDEEAWKSIAPIIMIMHSPVFGKEASEKTETRITYDDENVYVGATLFYSDSSLMRSASFKRDYPGGGCDFFGVILDTYNDKENALAFCTTPDALRWDASILKDANAGPEEMPFNVSWNTFWDVKTKKGVFGWSLEMRIPLSSLRFQESNEEVRMGLILFRYIPAKNEFDVFPAIPPNWGGSSMIKPSQAQEVVFHGITPRIPLYIAPYLLAGYESSYELNSQETEYIRTDKPALEGGLDMKVGLSTNMVLDLTLNTDFAQVEADDQQINLTRFSLYFPEKRLFFLERSSIFNFAMGDNNNLFYSRRIGLSDDGDPIRIYGGARLIGRTGKWDLGMLDMQTAPLWLKNDKGVNEEVLPSENFGVLRIRRQIFNENSYLGAITTSRLGMNGNYNLAYGLDGLIRVFGNDYLNFLWSQTFETEVINKSIKEPTRFAVSWERRSSKGLGYNIAYAQSGTHFNPGVGFEMLDDYAVIRGGLKYGWYPGESSKIYTHMPELQWMYLTYIDDGSLMTFNQTASWTFQTKSQWMIGPHFVYNIENLRDSLEIIEDEVYIPPGRYKYMNFMGFLVTPGSNPFYSMIMSEIGQFYDGKRLSVQLRPTYAISRHFELGGSYEFDWLKFAARQVKMINHIIGVRALYMLDTHLSANAYIQYNTAEKDVIMNFRIRYNPREGNDLYLVYNEGRNTYLDREMPHLPSYNTRAIMLKYTYTFSL
jgi:hypothetical protein